ncbi:MAG: hypothetical protein ACYC1Q_04065 [Bacteroidia bacterium]
MRSFYFKVVQYSVILTFALVFYLAAIGLLKTYQVDPFYCKLTSVHEEGLIIGSSRAAHGIDPEYLDGKIFNFAFTLQHSPYSRDYFSFIKKYHSPNPSSSKKIHIVEVNPWALSTNPNSKERRSFVNGLLFSPMAPNIEYLARYGGDALKWKFLTKNRVKSNGRYVVAMSREEVINRVDSVEKARVDMFRKSLKKGEYGLNYWDDSYLRKIVEYLQKDGEVYLVRMPVGKQILILENTEFPDFNSVIQKLCADHQILYINASDKHEFLTIDGNHIWHGDVESFSQFLKKSIKP